MITGCHLGPQPFRYPIPLRSPCLLPLAGVINQCQEKKPWPFCTLPPSPTPLLPICARLEPVPCWAGTKLDRYGSERAVPTSDARLRAGEGHPRRAPFPPFIRLLSFIIPSVFPGPEMMLGICDLGHSGRNWPAQGRPCVCLLAMQRSAANSLPPPPLSMGESERGPGCVGDTKR